MDIIIHSIIWLGLLGLGLIVLLTGLQFAAVFVIGIVSCVVWLWQKFAKWAKKDWRDDPKLKARRNQDGK
jgi:hypothetical protein